MKKIKLLSLLLLGMMVVISGCRKENLKSQLISENRMVYPFTAIEVSDDIELYINSGDVEEVTVETNASYIKHVITRVDNGVLHIYTDRNSRFLRPHCCFDVKVYVTTKYLSAINASGACSVCCNSKLETDEMNLELSGASEVEFYNLIANNVSIDASGASSVKLTGSAINLSIFSLSGASEVNAFNFPTVYTILDLSGASEANINVSTELDVTASGASVVKYIGNPGIIKQDLSGASELIKL